MVFGLGFLAPSAHGSFSTPMPQPWAGKLSNLRSARAYFPTHSARRYFASPHFLSLSAATQTNYRRAIDRFLIEHGHRRVDQMKVAQCSLCGRGKNNIKDDFQSDERDPLDSTALFRELPIVQRAPRKT
jgi:hypothetical protein